MFFLTPRAMNAPCPATHVRIARSVGVYRGGQCEAQSDDTRAVFGRPKPPLTNRFTRFLYFGNWAISGKCRAATRKKEPQQSSGSKLVFGWAKSQPRIMICFGMFMLIALFLVAAPSGYEVRQIHVEFQTSQACIRAAAMISKKAFQVTCKRSNTQNL